MDNENDRPTVPDGLINAFRSPDLAGVDLVHRDRIATTADLESITVRDMYLDMAPYVFSADRPCVPPPRRTTRLGARPTSLETPNSQEPEQRFARGTDRLLVLFLIAFTCFGAAFVVELLLRAAP